MFAYLYAIVVENYNDYFEANRRLWNDRTEVHKTSEFYGLEAFKAGKTSLNPIELDELGDVKNKTLLHLQCHFGMDTLSWQRLGAQATGVDLSESAIAAALELNTELGLHSQFVCSNIYDLKDKLGGQFDIVFTSYGTIGWLPDLDKWAGIISNFLKSGGIFYMADFHPVVWMFDDKFEKLVYPYYNKETIVTEAHGTYADRDAGIGGKEYGWNHSISEILNALINNGLEIQFFNEHYYSPYNCFSNTVEISPGCWQIKGFEDIIPMMYSIKAQKK